MKKRLLVITLIVAFVSLSYNAITYSSGPPTGYTDAPGESDCTSCHGGTVNSGSAGNNITLTTSTALSSLQPSTSYTFTLGFSETGRTRYGFELCVLPMNATGSSASVGTLTSTSTQTTTSSTGVPARTYLLHTSSGTSAPTSSKTWQFSYTTPAVITSPPVFYVAINSSNSDNSSSGDLIYTKSFSSTILPVKWGEIVARKDNGANIVSWSTETEINNNRFEIERSRDAYDWSVIASVKGNGNSRIKRKYTYNDITDDAVFYRIKQIDNNGLSSYSDVVGCEKNMEEKLQPMYNISSRSIVLPKLAWENLTLNDIHGNRLKIVQKEDAGNTGIDMHMFNPGIYIISGELNGRQHTWKIFAY